MICSFLIVNAMPSSIQFPPSLSWSTIFSANLWSQTVYKCFELLFPSPLSVALMPLIHAESNSCSTDMSGLLGTNKSPNKRKGRTFTAVTQASLHPDARAFWTWATGLPILGVPGDFASVSSVQPLLSRGKLTLPKITVVQWRHQLLPHWLVSCRLWEHTGNLQEIFVQWRVQTWVN